MHDCLAVRSAAAPRLTRRAASAPEFGRREVVPSLRNQVTLAFPSLPIGLGAMSGENASASACASPCAPPGDDGAIVSIE
jgi:hypothetical protein